MASSVVIYHPSHAAMLQNEVQGTSRGSSSPLVEFLFFHKAIRAELARLHEDALAVEQGSETEIRALLDRYHFLRAIYKHHSRAEDEVIFPALDLRVKNVAHAYSLEHQTESELFDQMFLLLTAALKEKGSAPMELRRELICCTEAIQTTLCQHLSKEEEQVFPLLMLHFNFQEQADLVWQFLCSIPVNLMEKFLPWLASSLTQEERQEMTACLEEIVPAEQLLQQVVFAWLEGGVSEDATRGGELVTLVSANVSLSSPNDIVLHGPLNRAVLIDEQTSQATTGIENIPRVPLGISEHTSHLGVPNQSLHIGTGLPEQTRLQHEIPDIFGEKSDRKLCEPDIGLELNRLQQARPVVRAPINELYYWHNAIRKELKEFAEETRRIQLSGNLFPADLSSFVERLQFLAEVCIFHSAAEDKVLFPAVNRKVKRELLCGADHAKEERQIDDVRRLVEGLQTVGDSNPVPPQLYGKLCAQAELMVKSISKHLKDEEKEVLPLARKHFSVEEQRTLLYQSLRVMPLKLLERVLPWLVGVLSEDEAKDMFQNMRLAAPHTDKALVTLFTGWACKGHPRKLSSSGPFRCISSRECPGMSLKPREKVDRRKISSSGKQVMDESLDDPHVRPLKRLRGTKEDEAAACRLESDSVRGNQGCSGPSCCVPGLGCSGIGSKSSGSSLRSITVGSSSPLMSGSMGSGLFGWGSSAAGSGSDSAPKPIDHIFQFHKAIRKDLEYLDIESARLADCTEEFLRHFSGRFQFLWGLYRAHSNAEDDIVFPALEAKEALHNVSHSYTIDHKQEEQLLKDISDVLAELSLLHSSGHTHVGGLSQTEGDPGNDLAAKEEIARRQRDLAGKLQRMCKSVRVSLDQHVSREELELWPLFGVHFTVEEQDKLVGQIIGTTGAEVLQAMLPWVNTALTEQEQNTMMDTWRQATRNTMFDQWLSAWWKDTPHEKSPQPKSALEGRDVPPSGSNESLQIVADYLAHGASSSRDVTMEEVSVETSVSQDSQAHSDSLSERPHSAGNEEIAEAGSAGVGTSSSSQENTVEHQEGKRNLVGDGSETFKPGWRDIFRMNQKELEAAIRKVSSDTSLDPRRKAYLIQNLMTSRWIVAQQQISNHPDGQAGDELKDPGQCKSYNNEAKGIYGCEHYKRNCKIKAACCDLLYTCRFCHDKVSDHSMDRHATKEMMCMQCLQVQPVAQKCANPSCNGYTMARYFCCICKFFDNDDRDIYHCPFCNLCRVGKGLGQDFFHCMTCNVCMHMSLSAHKCLEKGMESNCPICHDFLFTSSSPVKALPCGHFMHSACFKAYTCSNYTCPICCKSVGDMAVYFGMLDALLAAEQLPDEYHDRRQDILCNDCEKKGTAPFHWLYHKCQDCGSYNTRTI
ncbi:hypothetical protein Mapa_004113 [Marchantia paleacea]|nr:hypothetical protein Mapa_004113 [Marchantia paleacea]